MKDCCVTDIYRNLSAFFYNAAVRNVAAGREIARKINDVADVEIFDVFRGNGSDQNLLSVFDFYCHFIPFIPANPFLLTVLFLSFSFVRFVSIFFVRFVSILDL